MIQPISLNSMSSSPFLLSAYGSDNQHTSMDILMRWTNIVNQCDKNNIKLIGYSTDCDSRYIRAMRLMMGFFANMPNEQLHLSDNAFCVNIPKVVSLV
jgi:hypothetical protein